MTSAVHRLVYYSQNRLKGSAVENAQHIDRILASSRRNNALVEVTGALMFNASFFAQVLEGPQQAVEATFERIQQDPRHGDVSLLSFAPNPRAFGAWSMAFVGRPGTEGTNFATIGDESGFDPSILSGEKVFRILIDRLLEEEALPA